MSPAILVEAIDDVATLRLNRPEVLNALTVEMLVDLAAGIRRHGTDGGGDRAVILTGQGRAFSSGDDLTATDALDRTSFENLIDAFQDVTRAITETKVPVIAALNGIAVGGAAEIACACDLRVGGPASDFLFPENGLGLTISNGSSATLPALLGPRALGVVLLGERIAAERARQLGLIDVWIQDPSGVEAEARRIGSELGESTALHLSMLRLPAREIDAALRRERDAAMAAWDRGWPQAGVRRFLERRTGR
jgi:enoyl-CoA hydratase/carnithine racemase